MNNLIRFSATLTLLYLVVPDVPRGIDAQEKAINQLIESNETKRRIVLDELKSSRKALKELVVGTRPVVRSLDDLVLELARVEREVYESEVEFLALRSQVETITTKLEDLKKKGGSAEYQLELQQAEAKLQDVESQAEQQAVETERMHKLSKDGVVSLHKAEQAEANLERAKQVVMAYRNNLETLRRQTDPELAAYAKELQQRTERLKQLRLMIDVRKKRANELEAIFDPCFEYQKLSRAIIPALESELADIELDLKYLHGAEKDDSDE